MTLHHLTRDNEFNREINEEDIDFNIPGVPNLTVKRSHGVNVQNLIQKIENHPHRHALQSDLQQHRQFNPFSKESRDVIKAAGNTELCEIVDVEPKSTMQSMSARTGTLATSTARAVTSCEMRAGSLLHPELLHQERPATTGMGREKVAKNTTRQINFKRSVERRNTKTFTIDLSVIYGSERL